MHQSGMKHKVIILCCLSSHPHHFLSRRLVDFSLLSTQITSSFARNWIPTQQAVIWSRGRWQSVQTSAVGRSTRLSGSPLQDFWQRSVSLMEGARSRFFPTPRHISLLYTAPCVADVAEAFCCTIRLTVLFFCWYLFLLSRCHCWFVLLLLTCVVL